MRCLPPVDSPNDKGEVFMEIWKNIWRKGIAPLLSSSSLVALQRALDEADPHLAQGCVVFPRPVPSCWDLPPLALGFFAYCGMEGEGLFSIFEVSDFHDRMILAVDEHLDEPGACQEFLNWFDATERKAICERLLPEIRWELSQRHEKAVLVSQSMKQTPFSYEYHS